jgi:hypothetical protein
MAADPTTMLYAGAVRRLRRLCRTSQLVPTSCKLPHDVTDISAKPVCQSHFSDIFRGKLEGRDMAIKALRLHSDQIEEVKKASYICKRLNSTNK